MEGENPGQVAGQAVRGFGSPGSHSSCPLSGTGKEKIGLKKNGVGNPRPWTECPGSGFQCARDLDDQINEGGVGGQPNQPEKGSFGPVVGHPVSSNYLPRFRAGAPSASEGGSRPDRK